MRIQLISPAWRDPFWESSKTKSIFPPLNLLQVAALTPPDIEVSVVDEGLQNIDYSAPYDLVALTAMTAIAPRAYQIADTFRQRGIPVVMGGMHASALPQEALEHVDAVVVGEAESSWPHLISDFKAGQMQSMYRSQERPKLIGLSIPRRDLLNRKGYLVPNTVQTTRGCPFDCSFCTVTKFFGRTYRSRPIEEIEQELRSLDGKFVAFIDDNIVGNPSFAKKLFPVLAKHKIKWFSQGSITMAADDELLRMAADSGCMGMFIGFESLSPASLKEMKKSKVNNAETYRDAIKHIHSYGIAIEGAFVFGFDHDTEDVFEQTVRFAQETKLEAAQFGILTPFPGTPLRDKMEAEGRITDNDWSRYDIAHVVYEPMQMSAKTLQEGVNWTWQEFYSMGSIVRRLGLRLNYAPFLWALNWNIRQRVTNFISRFEPTQLADNPSC